jgi:hypothetical protein
MQNTRNSTSQQKSKQENTIQILQRNPKQLTEPKDLIEYILEVKKTFNTYYDVFGVFVLNDSWEQMYKHYKVVLHPDRMIFAEEELRQKWKDAVDFVEKAASRLHDPRYIACLKYRLQNLEKNYTQLLERCSEENMTIDEEFDLIKEMTADVELLTKGSGSQQRNGDDAESVAQPSDFSVDELFIDEDKKEDDRCVIELKTQLNTIREVQSEQVMQKRIIEESIRSKERKRTEAELGLYEEQYEWKHDEDWDKVLDKLEDINNNEKILFQVAQEYFPFNGGYHRCFHRIYKFLDTVFPSKVVVSNGDIKLSVLHREDKKLTIWFKKIKQFIARRVGKDELDVKLRKRTRMEIGLLERQVDLSQEQWLDIKKSWDATKKNRWDHSVARKFTEKILAKHFQCDDPARAVLFKYKLLDIFFPGMVWMRMGEPAMRGGCSKYHSFTKFKPQLEALIKEACAPKTNILGEIADAMEESDVECSGERGRGDDPKIGCSREHEKEEESESSKEHKKDDPKEDACSREDEHSKEHDKEDNSEFASLNNKTISLDGKLDNSPVDTSTGSLLDAMEDEEEKQLSAWEMQQQIAQEFKDVTKGNILEKMYGFLHSIFKDHVKLVNNRVVYCGKKDSLEYQTFKNVVRTIYNETRKRMRKRKRKNSTKEKSGQKKTSGIQKPSKSKKTKVTALDIVNGKIVYK